MTDHIAVGVDVGSSSTRAVAIDRGGSVLASSVADYPPTALPQGEVDPSVWLDGTIAAVAALDVAPDAICVGGQSPTTVAHTGELAITFRHVAGATSPPPEQHAAHLEVLRRRYGDHIRPRQLWDWVSEQLGSDAGLQSVWPGSDPMAEFGDAVPVGTVIGSTRDDMDVPGGIPLVAGGNDAYFTSWGSGIDEPGKGFDPGGTTGGLGVAVDAATHAEAITYGMATHVPGVYIVGGPVAAHGAMIDWWSRITGRSVPELLDLAEKAPPGASGVVALPFFEGERAPRWNPSLRAEIVGLHLDHDIGVVTRALVEATAYGNAHIARELAAQGVGLDRVVCSGGPARSRFWMQVKASILEVPVDVPHFHQMSSYGAAMGAGAALGWWPRPGEGTTGDWPLPERYTLEPEPLEVYRQTLDRFIALGDEAEARIK
jgi:sugar (pentulose or hexulose) kinase